MVSFSLVNLLVAFGAGVLSFLSPCVLPLVPAHLSFVGGYAGKDLEQAYGADPKAFRGRIFVRSLMFVLGFTLVFLLLGLVVVGLLGPIGRYKGWFERAAGVLILILGTHLLGFIRLPFLSRDVRYHGAIQGSGTLVAFLTGAAFGFGWTPCVGPILAGILALATFQHTFWQGFSLLIAYSLGLALPFFLAGVFVPQFFFLFKGLRSKTLVFEKVSGVLLIGLGIVLVLGKMGTISSYLVEIGLPTI